MPSFLAAPFEGARDRDRKRTTDRTLQALKPRAEPYDTKLDGPGLYIRTMPGGAKIFRLLRKSYDASKGRRATSVSTLGPYPALSLAEARRLAHARAGRVTGGGERVTVAAALARLFDAHASGAHQWRYNTIRNYGTYRGVLAGALGNRPLAEVKRAELADLLRRYSQRGPVAANRLSSFCTSFWRWCQGEGLTESDATASLGPKQKNPGGEEVSRDRVLSDAEIRDLWALDHPHANLLRGLLLSGCRIAELQKATGAHIAGDWLVIPPQHSKNKKQHMVFIAPEMREQFDGSAPLLFSAVTPTVVQGWLRRRNLGWSPHDLRRSFATIAARAGVQPHIIVQLINQSATDSRLSQTLGIYQRFDYLDERRAATLAVRDLLLEIVR